MLQCNWIVLRARFCLCVSELFYIIYSDIIFRRKSGNPLRGLSINNKNQSIFNRAPWNRPKTFKICSSL